MLWRTGVNTLPASSGRRNAPDNFKEDPWSSTTSKFYEFTKQLTDTEWEEIFGGAEEYISGPRIQGSAFDDGGDDFGPIVINMGTRPGMSHCVSHRLYYLFRLAIPPNRCLNVLGENWLG